MAQVLVLAGSARKDSLNKRLARVAADAARAAGAEVTFVDLEDYPMPLYHGDLETAEGIPAKARELGALVQRHRLLVIVSPEHNASVTALLKNTIDWLSRIRDTDVLGGRTAVLLSASPGAFGGVRGLYHLRAILNTLNVEVLAQQFVLPRAQQAFGPDGQLTDAKQHASLGALVERAVGRV